MFNYFLKVFFKYLYSNFLSFIGESRIKFFVVCGISFRIVEHPFFINLLKELNGGYDPPIKEMLSGQMLERELAQVNNNVKLEIEKETNLTIGL